MVLFKDLPKAASDVLKKDFAHEKRWEAEIKSKQDGFLLTQNYSLDHSGYGITAAGKYDFKNGHAELKAYQNGSFSVDAKYSAPKVKGLTFQGNYTFAGPKKPVADLSAEYNHKCTHAKINVQPLSNKFTGSFVFNCNYLAHLKTGASVEGALDMRGVQKYQFAASCNPNKESAVSLTTESNDSKMFNKVTAHASYKKGAAEYGAEAVCLMSAPSKPAVKLGVKYDVDKKTAVKAKIGSDYAAGVSVTQVINPTLSATFGTGINLAKISSLDSLEYGIKLNISH